jgi:MYXO-CTERM domain-containing protein
MASLALRKYLGITALAAALLAIGGASTADAQQDPNATTQGGTTQYPDQNTDDDGTDLGWLGLLGLAGLLGLRRRDHTTHADRVDRVDTTTRTRV